MEGLDPCGDFDGFEADDGWDGTISKLTLGKSSEPDVPVYLM